MDYIFVIQISIYVVILNLHILLSQLVENGTKIVSNRGMLNIHFIAEMFYCFHEYVHNVIIAPQKLDYIGKKTKHEYTKPGQLVEDIVLQYKCLSSDIFNHAFLLY